MKDTIEDVLSFQMSKNDLISFLDNNPQQFENAIKLSVSNDEKLSWRAAWLLNHYISKNDERIRPLVKKIIMSLRDKNDGHQRELLKIIEKMNISENHEGYLFDACVNIWEDISKSPSVRITAFRIIVNIVKKYPELKNEVESFTQKHFIETLSSGIKNSFYKLCEDLK